MSAWQKWLRRPQNTTLRKVFFQVHLWIGVALGLYILLMCASGTVLVYRVELSKRFSREPVFPIGQTRMTVDELKAAAQLAYPHYQIVQVTSRRNPNLAPEVLMRDGQRRVERLLNPFTGQDVGPAVTAEFLILQWLVDFHDDLLTRPVGRQVNGVGAVLVTLLSVSGLIIWWPGIGRWRERLTVRWKSDRNRLNWALHNALGVWSVGFVLMWGISGIYLCFPNLFNRAIDYFDPVRSGAARQIRFPDKMLSWLSQAHFGRFGGMPVKIIWTLFGILPIVLLVTGMVMWWHRVLRPIWRRGLIVRHPIKGAEPQAGD